MDLNDNKQNKCLTKQRQTKYYHHRTFITIPTIKCN